MFRAPQLVVFQARAPHTGAPRFFLLMYPPASRPSLPHVLDRDRLDAVIAPIARAHGAEIVDVELKSEPQGWVLRIYVEKLGSQERNASTQDAAVDLTLCSNVARELSPALDVVDVVPHRYHL